jgi:hypothetical protein
MHPTCMHSNGRSPHPPRSSSPGCMTTQQVATTHDRDAWTLTRQRRWTGEEIRRKQRREGTMDALKLWNRFFYSTTHAATRVRARPCRGRWSARVRFFPCLRTSENRMDFSLNARFNFCGPYGDQSGCPFLRTVLGPQEREYPSKVSHLPCACVYQIRLVCLLHAISHLRPRSLGSPGAVSRYFIQLVASSSLVPRH